MSWRKVLDPGTFGARVWTAGAVFDNALWLMGGSTSGAGDKDVWCSTDGVTWTQTTSAAAFGAHVGGVGAAFDSQLWLVGSGVEGAGFTGDATVWRSPDGVTWTAATTAPTRNVWGTAVMNGKLFAAGVYGVSETSDGTTWSSPVTLPFNGVYSAATMFTHAGKLFVINTQSSGVYTSTDGTTWSAATLAAPFPLTVQPHPMETAAGVWLALDKDVWGSADGINWTKSAPGAFGGDTAQMAYVLGGELVVVATSTSDAHASVWVSP